MSTFRPSDIDPDLHDLIRLFREFALKAQRYEQSALHPLATTPARVHLLCELFERGAISMQSLAHSLSIAPRSVTSLVDALEREGKVKRSAHPSDRRSTLVSLSPLGKKEAQAIGPKLRAHMGALFEILSETERQSLFSSIQKLIARIDTEDRKSA
ncbi:MAG: MarR family transcriptional regulator [Pseudomonadota bacterium]